MKRVVIFGATSAIAVEVARRYAASGAALDLCARTASKLQPLIADLQVRGAKSVATWGFDAEDPASHEALCAQIATTGPAIDVVFIAHGSLPDQIKAQDSYEDTNRELKINLLSPIAIVTFFAKRFEELKGGTIAAITSVAGDRGRKSNYIYGSAKGGLSLYLQGVRNRLAKANVTVLDIRPGFVDTPMTTDFKKGPIWASPQKVASDIQRAIDRKKDILYTPWFWWPIMQIIKGIPEGIFKRLSL